MRQVRLVFITTIPDADTDDQAYLMADAEVAELVPPGNWEFDGMEIKQFRGSRDIEGAITIYDYDEEGHLTPRVKR